MLDVSSRIYMMFLIGRLLGPLHEAILKPGGVYMKNLNLLQKNIPIIGKLSVLLVSSLYISACGSEGSSFSLLADADEFQQSSGISNSKVDILWLIDNSGSMETSQTNVINNLQSFIQDFQGKNLDFKMAVATTDAYRTLFNNNKNCSQFRDRILNSSCATVSGRPSSGYRVMDLLTPNLQSVFTINTSQTDAANSIGGSGDERAFQSIKTALDLDLNQGFLRADSFFSVIIISDEDDLSHNTSQAIENMGAPYNTDPRSYPNIHTTQSYVDYLDALTASGTQSRRYSVNAMAIFDTACQDDLNTSWSGRKIGIRYGDLIDRVNTGLPSAAQGLKGSLCGNFATELSAIADSVLTLSTKFKLARTPIPETIVVKVNNNVVPKQSTNPANNGGWIYEAATNEILFVGAAYIPPAGSSIRVDYDPAQYGN